jgi:uncharacterized protein (TIGR02284 family)
METIAMTTEILNDLVQINNDRIVGYEKAIKELKEEDSDLKVLFTDMIRESHRYKMALATELSVLGADIEGDTTTSGKIYRAWMDVKAVFTGHDRKAILASCEFGEDAAQKAYETALEEEDLPSHIVTLIAEQKQSLRLSHDQIKALRNQQIN